ncbi:MAG: TfoX/Sxy family protein [Eubacteriales bacterium]|nr:TfoX/Sxy family protein [Eubacteriales bacterium]
MASTLEYIQYVCEQLAGSGEVRYRKMFGEYMVYVNDKPLLLVCDNTTYVKMRDELAGEMHTAERATPYTGAKEHYILDIDDVDLTRRIIAILEPIVPLPTPKKKKTK